MATNLTPELQQALDQQQGLPVRVVDPRNQQEYVVMRAEFYDRMMATLDLGEPSAEEKTAMLQRFAKTAGWDDPGDAVFDELKPL